jgi:hypothetical protein
MKALWKSEFIIDYLGLLELSIYTRERRKQIAGWGSGPNERKVDATASVARCGYVEGTSPACHSLPPFHGVYR